MWQVEVVVLPRWCQWSDPKGKSLTSQRDASVKWSDFSVCKVLQSSKLQFILTRHNQTTHLAWTNVNQHSRKIARFLKLFSSFCIIFSKSVVMPRNGGFKRRLQSARVIISVDLFSRVVTFIIAVPHIPPRPPLRVGRSTTAGAGVAQGFFSRLSAVACVGLSCDGRGCLR